MEELIARLVGILIVAAAIMIAQHFESERTFRKWEKLIRRPWWDGRFHYKGQAESVSELYKIYRTKYPDDYSYEVGDVLNIGTSEDSKTVLWDGKNFIEIGMTIPFEEKKLKKCMCCGKMVDRTFCYEAPSPNSRHGHEWMGVNELIICSECGKEWARLCNVDGAGTDDEIQARITAGNKWMFDRVLAVKKLEEQNGSDS